MIEEYKTEGFIFKKEDRQEADKVFSIFTKDFGRIEVVGKAIRKINSKLRANIEIFSLSKIEFVQGKNKKTLTDAILVKSFKNVKAVPEKLEIAYKISNILDRHIRGQEKDDNIFDLIIDVFDKLNEIIIGKQDLVYFYFIWNFISTLGYSPELFFCCACKNKLAVEYLYFSNKEGGILCKSCFENGEDGVKVLSDSIKMLRLFLKKDWSILLKLKIENNNFELLEKISNDYYQYILSHNNLISLYK